MWSSCEPCWIIWYDLVWFDLVFVLIVCLICELWLEEDCDTDDRSCEFCEQFSSNWVRTSRAYVRSVISASKQSRSTHKKLLSSRDLLTGGFAEQFSSGRTERADLERSRRKVLLAEMF